MSCKIKGKGKGKIKSRQKENTFSSYQTNNQQPTNHERKQTMKKTLADAVKGMQVKSWEVREHSDGRRRVYVRFAPKEPALTVDVKGE